MEYLTTLREIKQKQSGSKMVTIDEVVQIYDESPCISWHLGVVTKLIKGKDGDIRSVILPTNSGETSRAVAKLYPLEVRSTELTETSPKLEHQQIMQRPRRKASIHA